MLAVSRASRLASVALSLTVLLAMPPTALAQRHITSPQEQFGFAIGDDYKLANYTQFARYWHTLASESDRMKLVDIGSTAEGRTQLMAIISSPANIARLDHYRNIATKLARGEAMTEDEAHRLAKEGKTVVWIDGGLHATEVLGAAQLIQFSYEIVSRSDPETMRFLDDCIILAVHANPDGMELVSNWYMKDADTLVRNLDIPRLYQKYVGHDNNRDFYMSTQPETRNINHVLYQQWYPQIVYNHHQTGPAGTVMFAPPFRDPFNFSYDPLVVMELDLVAAAMHTRFEAEGKPGVTMRSGSNYSTWWNGGLRTVPYFHNMIGLLTETIGSPTPTAIPFIPEQQLPRADLPYPIAPQPWHFRQSIAYSLTANRAVLDIASRERANLLFNSWRMARNSIERGSRDSWTASPSGIESVQRAIAATRTTNGNERARMSGADTSLYTRVLHAPDKRDARGYVLPSDQPDFLTATKFVDALQHVGVQVERATAPFRVAGKQYPEGSYVVMSAQAFRPMVLDMFEPQDHPNDFAYPGGPPRRPYDNAGWTLALQMGVHFDRILDGFSGPFSPIEGLATPPRGTVATVNGAAGYLVNHATNDAWIAVNRAIAAGADVRVLRASAMLDGKQYPAGTFYIAANSATTAMLQHLARTVGVSADATREQAPRGAQHLRPRRIALWDRYGGSMPSGHTRWLLEQFGFPYEVVYPQTLDAGNLASRYDVIVLPSGALPAHADQRSGASEGDTTGVPKEYRKELGRLTIERTIPRLREFLQAGGTVVAVGTSAAVGTYLGLPMTDALVDTNTSGAVRRLTPEQFYVPGSLLAVRTDTTLAVDAGMPPDVDVLYDNSPAFRLGAGASEQGLRRIAWFASPTPLRSGWAWGQSHLDGAVVAAQAHIGKGMLYMFAPEITFRSQPHGTFKWLFNSIYGDSQ